MDAAAVAAVAGGAAATALVAAGDVLPLGLPGGLLGRRASAFALVGGVVGASPSTPSAS